MSDHPSGAARSPASSQHTGRGRPKRTGLLVLGLGNLLCRDDGVGVEVVRRLHQEYETPPGAVVLDGGTLGLALLPHIEDAERVILADAIRTDQAPGTLVRIDGDEVVPAVAERLSVHQIGVLDLLNGARWLDQYPADLILWGVVPERLDLGLERTPAVEARVPDIVARIVAEARGFGFEFRRRADHDMRRLDDPPHEDVRNLAGYVKSLE